MDTPVARLGTLRADLVFDASPELDALLNGRALDLPAPAPELARFQAGVLDALLRGTVAPLGEHGLLCIHDELRGERTEQRVSLRPSPRLLAARADSAPLPAVDPARLRAALEAMPTGPVDAAALDAALERLGYARRTAPIPAGLPDALVALIRRCGSRVVGHLEIHALLEPGPSALAFADDNAGEVWSICTVEATDDPGVLRNAPLDQHDCRLHRTRLSTWLAGLLIAAELETLAPADLDADALAAIAARLEVLGRPAGELAHLLWRSERWFVLRPDPSFDIGELRVRAGRGLLELTVSNGYPTIIPADRLYDVFVFPTSAGPVLRLWGTFDGLSFRDVGPLQPVTAEAAVVRLRAALGLPRPGPRPS